MSKDTRLLYIAGRDKDGSSCFGKQFGSFLKRLKKNLAYDPAVPFLGIQLKGLKTNVHIGIGCVPSAHSSIIYNIKKWKQSKCLSSGE